ncbi:GNAT family N-acetyltransferase [Micromonospora endolithica]|uniref:GNAT family N-acetyltransferase n=1 Tax=Micromonospora endolithica TaxID=230091 RepID=A0A3A9ZH34_9ACTN|nr:GNAT family N-acetyltransferase [Micromonospora endolithica]RKN47539.1 GNAT family N-acetyltransferase [Micromonospora endolithica]TWJ21180.1 GNAT acetyltransferase-like protein [Micromonospora endolithica]
MAGDPLLARAREVWLEMSGVAMAFPAVGGVAVAVSARSLLCPPGWVGIVALGDAAIVTVSADSWAGIVREGLRGLPLEALSDADRLCAVLPVTEVLGPTSLAYLDECDFKPAGFDTVEVLPAGHADLAALLASVPVDDADECGLADITSDAFVVRHGNDVVAAAGYRRWPGAAHMCVLTETSQRGRGLARAVASAAVADGLANHLLPQWRARPEPSRRVARALGFCHLGAQLSIRIET